MPNIAFQSKRSVKASTMKYSDDAITRRTTIYLKMPRFK